MLETEPKPPPADLSIPPGFAVRGKSARRSSFTGGTLLSAMYLLHPGSRVLSPSAAREVSLQESVYTVQTQPPKHLPLYTPPEAHFRSVHRGKKCVTL